MGPTPILHKLVVVDRQKRDILLSFSKTTLTVNGPGLNVECPLRQVLWAEVTEGHRLRVSLLRKRKKKSLALHTTEGSFDAARHEDAERWANDLVKTAYDGCKLQRRLKIMINPHGGTGKAKPIFENKVKPIFEAARCQMDILVTERHKHCYEHTVSMGLDYDAVVVLSGDGLVHEVFNAFADREDAMNAFALPVVQIPTGSANGFSICLLGLEDGVDVRAAALNVIKGRPMKLDMCSVQQGQTRTMSFMSQAIGLMADIDLGTEPLRWMGDARFMLGYFRQVALNRGCSMRLEIKIAAQDKTKMVESYRLSRSQVGQSQPKDVDIAPSSQSLPPLHHINDTEGWTLIDKPLAYVYAGKLPYVSRDLMQFPVALCDDGYIDIVAQEQMPRVEWIKGMDGASQGKLFWRPTQLYYKAKAYRLTPHAKDGHFSLDGEKYPYAPFQVEVHERLATTLGYGNWYPEFNS